MATPTPRPPAAAQPQPQPQPQQPQQQPQQPSSWLLRLFESDFFDARLALSYLHRHPDSVGIQHYICNELRRFPENDIEFLLPQLCHMTITRPSQSAALEAFLADLCRSSQHMALLTLWYLEAYLKEMQAHNVNNASSRLCQRMYQTCQTIIFDDSPPLAVPVNSHASQVAAVASAAALTADSQTLPPGASCESPAAAVDSPATPVQRTPRRIIGSAGIPGFGRIHNHTAPAIVGMGVMLAGFGNPAVHRSSAGMILSQARHPREASTQQELDVDQSDLESMSTMSEDDGDARSALSRRKSTANSIMSTSQQSGIIPLFRNLRLLARIPTSSPSLEELSKGSAFSFTNFVRKTTDIVAGTLGAQSPLETPTMQPQPQGASGHMLRHQASNASFVLGGGSAVGGSLSATTAASGLAPATNGHGNPMPSPTRTSVDGYAPHRRLSNASIETNSTVMALRDQSHLLHSHYFHSEMQFIMTLVDISDRLRFVPKPARQSNLVAELTLLNHNLPADVCIPFWCPAEANNPVHHRVVRISPSDAVVLNSADRVPFLIMVEVVATDHRVMSRKAARQILEQGGDASPAKRGPRSSAELTPPEGRLSTEAPRSPNDSSAEYYREVLERRRSLSIASKQQAMRASPTKEHHDAAPESPAEAASPRLDADVAARAAAHPVHALINTSVKNSPTSISSAPANLQASLSSPSRGPASASVESVRSLVAPSPSRHSGGNLGAPSLSGDEFSNRMRTAAVMLAQLYQQQQKELAAISSSSSSAAVVQPPASGAPGGVPPSGSFSAAHNRSLDLAASATTSGASTPRSSNDRSRSSSAVPGSPSVAADRRNYNKLRNDFEEIRARVIKEMMALEQQRMEALAAELGSNSVDVVGAAEDILPEQQEQKLRTDSLKKDAEDPSGAVFREPWSVKKERIRTSSPFGRHPNWDLLSVIVKSGADLRQEKLALQLIAEIQNIWMEHNVPVWVYSFRMLITSEQSGLVETVRDAISIHSIKKEGYARQLNQQGIAYTLYDYFVKEFGQPGCDSFQRAQDNFMRSLAGYSIICYLLQIKDRHNGNILLDLEGRCTHIDFGFMLTNSPGSVGFELAPFKLPQEYIDILGGLRSEKFREFRALVREAFLALRKSADSILCLVEIMERDSTLPCFTGITTKPSNLPTPSSMASMASIQALSAQAGTAVPPNGGQAAASAAPPSRSAAASGRYPVTEALRERFQLSMTEAQVCDLVDRLIDSSCNNIFTKLYDSFQYYANGIL
ncbi:Phosphatidylinositol 4-kinase pik1alpha (PI4-kinase)(PtdIns-4-kinase) [Polyrhizophydium stewartii]|uniref:1-phosphatidylinositol 4-kinase n=1 Tax=Polyrhizophydium stewartii TaxID=2732419 RepID=A0ABR4NE88_9FUNG